MTPVKKRPFRERFNEWLNEFYAAGNDNERYVQEAVELVDDAPSRTHGHWHRKVVEDALNGGPVPTSMRAFSVFALCRLAQVERALKDVARQLSFTDFHAARKLQGVDTLPGEAPRAKAAGDLVKILNSLRSIFLFARGESPEGYALVQEFRSFARCSQTFDELVEEIDEEAGTCKLGMGFKAFNKLRKWSVGREVDLCD